MEKVTLSNGKEYTLKCNVGSMMKMEQLSRDEDAKKNNTLASMLMVLSQIQGADRHSTITIDELMEDVETMADFKLLSDASGRELQRYLNTAPEHKGESSEGNE